MVPPSLLLAVALTGGGDLPLAPDGRRGLGAETPLQGLRDVVQGRKPEDEAFLAGLRALESELSARLSTAEALYHRRGYFEALPWHDPADLEHLEPFLFGLLVDPEPALAGGDPRAPLLQRMVLDIRLRVRFEVLAGWERDATTIARGLLVLRAESEGWSRLVEAEAANLAARVDLSAALLRARIRDLEALREDLGAPAEVDPSELDELARLGALPPGRERSLGLAGLLERVDERAARMRSLLFVTRLTGEAAGWLSWRAEQDRIAAEALAEVLVLRPDTGAGEQAPREIEQLGKTTRRRLALERAREGLAHDPLDPELTYSAGIMAEYVFGRLETLSLFDRYLALRGIRPDDDRNWRERELTEEESHALFYIQRIGGPGGG
jgi:hypothetical protein